MWLIAKRVLALALLTASACAAAQNEAAPDRPVQLPIKSLQAIQENGQIFLVSGNGRFVFSGQLYDLWSKQSLVTMAQMQDAAERLHFKRMGLDVDTLNTITLGEGPQEVVAFIDPRCSFCHALIQDAQALTHAYTFKLIVIPALGPDSNRLAKALYCAQDKTNGLSAILNDAVDALPPRANCDTGRYDQTLLTAQILGIEGVPLVVAPDGRVSHGRPVNLSLWLEGPSQ